MGLLINAREQTELDTLFDAALECMARGNPAAAVDHFERILYIDPGHIEATHGLIRALVDSSRIDEALEATRQLIASRPDDVLALTRLSMIYQHKGMIAEAEAAATRAKILGWKQQLRSGIEINTDL